MSSTLESVLYQVSIASKFIFSFHFLNFHNLQQSFIGIQMGLMYSSNDYKIQADLNYAQLAANNWSCLMRLQYNRGGEISILSLLDYLILQGLHRWDHQ